MSEPLRLGAVVLTGGTGSRLGGADKAALEIDGVTTLERALAATMAAREVVVVGEQVTTSRSVTWTREQPAGGGPAAAVLAGLRAFGTPPEVLCVLAVDMPRVNAGTVARLTWAVEAEAGIDGALLVDARGHRQFLAAAYRPAALAAAAPIDRADEHGLSMRRLVGGLRLVDVPAVGDEAHDLDTWDDVRALRP